MTRFVALVGALIASAAALAGAMSEQQAVDQWRAARVAELTSETGWLTLVGLYWLEKGDNTFGRAPSNRLVLDHPALPPRPAPSDGTPQACTSPPTAAAASPTAASRYPTSIW